MSYPDLLDEIKKNNITIDENRLKQVYDFAAAAHAGQVRDTGDATITHPLSVAKVLATWHQPQPVLEAALLHDVVEDTDHSLAEIASLFGDEVAFLVDGVTVVGKVKLRGSTDTVFVENLRKMFVAMARDIRVILIRLADRFHNMQTLDAVPLSKQQRIAKETIEVYAPLAERLGMGQLKGDLEDLAFPFLYPTEHQWLMKEAKTRIRAAEKTTTKAIQSIKELFTANEINAEIHGRHKRNYSLYKKLNRPGIDGDWSKIHDLVALRIITTTKRDCYAALGLVHGLWQPAPTLGISDFIAQPKPNGYQSIHTKVFDHKGNIIEIQIRTREMHEQAEYGAAAHTLYAQAKYDGASDDALEKGMAFQVREKMDWIKELANWQKETESNEDYVNNLKLDALSERIYVFSPHGDVYDLPKDATPVDFAFAVHSDLGLHIQGAKVNQKIVPLNYQLKSGDLVEIIKSKDKHLPNRDWLPFVKTSKARGKITKLNRHGV
ncbi:MAG: RelA/SpoT family protein [Patescibacteria group bacterium]